MNNERAIELLHRLQDEQFDGIHGDERREALEMAVRALESNLVKESGDLVKDLVEDSSSDLISRQETIEYCAGNKTWHDEDRATGDTIYRQDAIDEVINLWADKPFGNPTLVEIKDCIEALPSAQQGRIRFVQHAVNTIMHVARSDSIKDKSFRNAARLIQNAIDGEPQDFEPIPDETEPPCYLGSPCEYQNKDIKLPSAQPERKTGQLLYHHTEDIDEERTADVYFCSSCKEEVLKKIRFGFCRGELDIHYGFCPICGARLSGENDD